MYLVDKMPPLYRFLLFAVCAALCGFAWGSGSVWLFPLASLPPILWIYSGRKAGGFFMAAYFLTASRALPGGSAVFFGNDASWVLGVGLWLSAAIVSSAPWWICWATTRQNRALWAPVLLLVSAIPPIGFVSWTSPLMVAGAFYPGLGWFGLAALCAAYGFIGMRGRLRTGGLVLLVVLAGAAHAFYEDPAAPPQWAGRNTAFGKLVSEAQVSDSLDIYERLADVRRAARAMRAGDLVVMPETVLGTLDGAVADEVKVISDALVRKNGAMLVGAEVPAGDGRYYNSVVGLGALHGVVFHQRVPVPVSMWRPWSAEGAVADWHGGGVSNILGKRSIILICYEQLLLWPYLLSSIEQPEVIIGVANDWWARNSNIPLIQEQSMWAVARLFGWPRVSAVNI